MSRGFVLEEGALRNTTRTAHIVAASPPEEAGEALRFTSGGLASHRKRLGLSAGHFGKLVEVSGQTYAWEGGKSRLRQSQLAAIVAVRRLGKREAAERLAS